MKSKKELKKNVNIVLMLTLLLAMASSCIPNEKVIYLQNKGGEETPEYGIDTLIQLSRQDYRLQPNDILLINFYSAQPQAVEKFYPLLLRTAALGVNQAGGNGNNGQQNLYFTGYNVDKDGFVEVNGLGRVQAAGLTKEELKYKLEEQIKAEQGVNDILVNVKLDGIRYTIFGEVNGPGPQTLQQYEANIIEAIASSGDLTLNANREHVQIIRQYPDGVRIHEVNVTDRKLLSSPYYFLQPNDIIYVPPLKIRELGTGETGLSTFSSIVGVISGTALIISLINNN